MLVHQYITVNEDEMKKEPRWNGTLADYAAMRFNDWQKEMLPYAKIVSVESSSWISEIRPVMCNSGTWYDRRTIQLSVWLESDRPIPVKIQLTEKGRIWMKGVDKFLEKEFLWLVSEPNSDGFASISTEPVNAETLSISSKLYTIDT